MENGHPDISEANSESTDVDPYENKYYSLLRRCENIQQGNEHLVHRLYRIKGILRRLRHERRFLMRRLDQHEDNYRDVPLKIPLGQDDELTGPMTTSESQNLIAVTPNYSSSTSLNPQLTENDTLRSGNDVSIHNQLNNTGISVANWSQNMPSTSACNTLGPASTSSSILLTSKRKRSDKSSSKTSNKKSCPATTSAAASPSTSSGIYLKNALTDYGHITKSQNDLSEKIS